MSAAKRAAAHTALWEAMVDRAEKVHEAVVRGQRRAGDSAAGRVQGLAEDLAALARSARLLAAQTGRS